jgi:hypothetical protein
MTASPPVRRASRRIFSVCTVVPLAAALLAPAPSISAVAPVSARQPQTIQITTRGTSGYGIEISGDVEGPRSTVTLTTGKPFSNAAYSVGGTITPDRVQASFGKFGSVSLKLVGYKVRKVTISRSCRRPGDPAVARVRIGTFVGRIRFHGERGFTSASARRVHGAVGEPRALAIATLPGDDSEEADAPRLTTLQAMSKGGATLFLAFSDGTGTSTSKVPESAGAAPGLVHASTFVAADSEQRGAVEITRSTTARAPLGDFTFDNLLTTAAVTPPAPFSGTGSFVRDADGTTSWSGSLAVAFPGEPRVPLIGPQFTASLDDESHTH